MEPTAHPRRTGLPGTGVRHDLNTEVGPHPPVVAHQDGHRIVAVHGPEEDDGCGFPAAPTSREASAPAEPLAPDRVAHPTRGRKTVPVAGHLPHLPVTLRGPSSGRAPAGSRVRSRSEVSTVALPRGTTAVPSPTPSFRCASGDVPVIGTREGVDAVADPITGG